MRLSFKQLKHLSVETRSGTFLGHVHELTIDATGQMILQYTVRTSLIDRHEYLIHREQVISVSEKKMIVDDGVKKATEQPPAVEPLEVVPKSASLGRQA